MTVLSAVQTYIKTYGALSGAAVLIDFLGAVPTQYAIIPLPGTKVVEQYIDGGSAREFSFALQSMESTADELERLDNIGFFETFSDWLESQTKAGILPTLAAGKTPTKIEALGWAFLYEQGQSATGIYQVQCALTYDQVP
jgi:hypothetical protein